MIVIQPGFTPACVSQHLRHLMAGMMACLLGSLSAGEVKLAWNANPEPDIAGYVLHYGTESGNLTEFQDTGNVTTTTVGDLMPSTTYYFALQAYNTSGMFSELCEEISHTMPAPAPTGLVIRDEAGNVRATDDGLLDLGIVRFGAMGAERRFTLTNHGTETVSGLRWLLDDAGVENFVISGMPLVAMVNKNGSFEHGFTGWASEGQVRTRTSSVATHGAMIVDFSSGDSPNDGILSKTFPTVPGKFYTLQFDLGIRCYNFNPQTLRTRVRGDTIILSNVSSINGPGGGATVWQPKSFEFIADSALTTLTFEDISTTTTGLDLMLDHVRVIDVEASSVDSGLSLAAGKSITFTVRFKPTIAGARQAWLGLMKDGQSQDVYGFDVRSSGSVSFDEWLSITSNDVNTPGGPHNALQKFAFGLGSGNAAGKSLAFANGAITARGTPAVIPPTGPGKALQGVFVRRKDRIITGMVYRPQFSADLIHWHDATEQAVVVADDGEIEIASVSAPDEIDGKPVRFFRMGLEQVAPPSSHDFVKWLAHHEVAEVSPGTTGKQQLTGMLMEYAFGLNPGSGPAGAVSEIEGLVASRGNPDVRPPAAPGETFKGIFGRRKNHADAALEYRPQFSADLIHWHDAEAGPEVLADDGEIQVVSVTAPEELDGLPARFFRVGVNGPMPEPPEPLGFSQWLENQEAEEPEDHHLIAFAFGLPPGSQTDGQLVEAKDNAVLRGHPNVAAPGEPQQPFKGLFGRRKYHADVGLEYRPQFSADLIHWQDAEAGPVVLADDGEIQVVSVAAPDEIDGQPARFFRVGIMLPPES